MKIVGINQRAIQFAQRQRGASLLEGVAYLGIAAIVLLGAVSLIGGAFSNAQSNRATEELIALRTAAKKLFSGQNYPADMVPILVAAKAVPGTFTINGSGNAATIASGFGGTVTIEGTDGTGENTFTITYPNVPPESCIAILSGTTGWTAVSVGNTSVNLPIDAATAQTNCGTANTTLAFTAT